MEKKYSNFKEIPYEVIERFKELNEQIQKGQRKDWALSYIVVDFKPFENFNEKLNKILNSSYFRNIERKLN